MTTRSVYQASYDLLCERLRGVLRDAVQAGRGAAGGTGSVPCRVSAALFSLLMAHPVDRRGRCRSCRRPGAVFGRRRRCLVRIEADHWLHQPEDFLRSQLARELGLSDPSQTPAVAPSPPPRGFPRAGRPDLDHGEAGEPTPKRPRPRRAPPDDQPLPHSARSPVITT